MKFYYVWLTLPLAWRRGDPIYPQAAHLHYIGDGFFRAIRGGFKTVVSNRRGLRVWEVAHLVRLPESKVRELLRSDAQGWGDTYDEEEFDRGYIEKVVNRLYSTYQFQLEKSGELDFTVIKAGVANDNFGIV